MNTIYIKTRCVTERLRYTVDWIFRARLGIEVLYCDAENAAPKDAPVVCYDDLEPGAYCVPSAGLLERTGFKKIDPIVGQEVPYPTLFAIRRPGYQHSFDLFSAVFYLLSRYEEYDTFEPDQHGRYPATASLLSTLNALHRPLVDEWVAAFGDALALHFKQPAPARKFKFEPTYDIDIAFAHAHRGLKRTLGNLAQDLWRRDFETMRFRFRTLSGLQKDPYDTFSLIHSWHENTKQPPKFFILAALTASAYDKNISPKNNSMRAIIKRCSQSGKVGIHPSYYAVTLEALTLEKQTIEQITGLPVTDSRQHYIRVRIPETYNHLISLGITDDHSMGYSTVPGFRAGTGSPFLWYNLEAERITALTVHPFCFMDTMMRFEQRVDAATAFETLRRMEQALKDTGSTLVTIFHNFSLGPEKGWENWKAFYCQFLGDME